MTLGDILRFIIPIGLGGIGSFVGFVFLLPTKVGERLIGHHFDAKIAALKHEHGKELGRLQADLDHLKDRGIRSNEKEYQAITAVWESFVDAFIATKAAVAQILEFPDLNKLSPEDVRDFLEEEKIVGRTAERIIAAQDRNASYSRNKNAHSVWLAGDTVLKTLALLRKQSVFIPEDLSAQFNTILDELNAVRIEQHMQMRPEFRPLAKIDKSLELIGPGGQRAFDDLRNAVRDRLLRTLSQQQGWIEPASRIG